MVLTSDTYPGDRYNQQTYTVAQGGYCNPQTGYPYSSPMGTGYNSSPVSHTQYQNFPTGDVYSNQHGYGHDHGHGHGHSHGHGHGHGHGHDHGHGHGHGHGYEQNHNYKYQSQNQHHGMTTYSAADLGFVGNHYLPTGHAYGPSYGSGPGKFSKIYSAYKEADD